MYRSRWVKEGLMKVVIVGSSRGIGRVIAEYFAGQGHEVYGIQRDDTPLPGVETLVMSLRKLSDFERIHQWVPDCDCFIQVTGPFCDSGLEPMDAEVMSSLFDLNSVGPIWLALKYLKSMVHKSWGRLLFFGQSDIEKGRPYTKTALYTAAKIPLVSFVKSVSASYSELDVSATLVSPGIVDTGLDNRSQLDQWARVLSKTRVLSSEELFSKIVDFFGNKNSKFDGKVVTVE